jgi:hypothetical protein
MHFLAEKPVEYLKIGGWCQQRKKDHRGEVKEEPRATSRRVILRPSVLPASSPKFITECVMRGRSLPIFSLEVKESAKDDGQIA